MKVAVIGAGMIGGTLGKMLIESGYEVCFGTRHPDRVKINGASSTNVASAMAWGDVIVLAVPLGESAAVAASANGAFVGKVILDAGNAYPRREPEAVREIQESGKGSGHWVARHFPGARVVKAFNTVYFQSLLEARWRCNNHQVGIPIASDDRDAIHTAQQLISDLGFVPVVVGELQDAKCIDVGTPAWNSAMTAIELEGLLTGLPIQEVTTPRPRVAEPNDRFPRGCRSLDSIR